MHRCLVPALSASPSCVRRLLQQNDRILAFHGNVFARRIGKRCQHGCHDIVQLKDPGPDRASAAGSHPKEWSLEPPTRSSAPCRGALALLPAADLLAAGGHHCRLRYVLRASRCDATVQQRPAAMRFALASAAGTRLSMAGLTTACCAPQAVLCQPPRGVICQQQQTLNPLLLPAACPPA